jgi:enoyl-CoA hydratase/carnithine racemase
LSNFDFAVTSAGAVARLDLNRPEEGNPLDRALMFRFAELLRQLATRPETGVIVIEARGEKFCRGRDGKGESLAGISAYEMRTQRMAATLGVYEAIGDVPVPVIALVHGDATGFGAALVAACDVALASAEARFSFPELSHGIAPVMAMTPLARRLPPKATAHLIYGGGTVSARRAAEIGLVSAVFDAATFAAEADAFVAKVASTPRVLLETVKKFQKLSPDISQAMASEYAGTLMALLRSSPI